MKSKKMTYLLIACVAGVWGIIFFKIYAGLNTEEDKPVANVNRGKADYFNLVDHRADGFRAVLDYRDPFSVAAFVPVEKVKEETSNSGARASLPIAIKPPVNWPGLQYKGYISNPVNKQKVAVMVINGKEAMLSEGQVVAGIKLLQFTGDSVKVSYQQNIKYISIK